MARALDGLRHAQSRTRLHDNSEDVGLMLWKQMRPDDDFQHLPSWRELVVATALSLRRHDADTLIVPISLIRDAYRAEILGDLDCTAGHDRAELG